MDAIYRARFVVPISTDIIEDGEVLVEDGQIREVGKGIAARYPNVAARDLGRAALLPGFVNAHSHIDYTLSRNKHDGLNFWEWISRVAFRKNKRLPYEVLLASARLGAALCAASGITCLGDSSFSGVAVEAVSEMGLRGVVYKEIFGQSMGAEYQEGFACALSDVRVLQSGAGKLVKVGLSPHTVYTTNIEVLRLCAETCANMDMPVAMHLAETRAEAEYTRYGNGPIAEWRRELGYEPMVSGMSPTDVLAEAGLLRCGVSLAHCVHLSEEEVALVAGSGAAVVHCPRSNARLGAGVAPVPAMVKAEAVVGLGTDSTASCGELDFFDEMRCALGVNRAISEDAGAILAKDVLEMATAGGAAALGLADVGTLEPGMRADILAVDVGGMLPGEDICLALLSRSPADVKMVLVDGEPIEADVEARTAELRELMERSDLA